MGLRSKRKLREISLRIQNETLKETIARVEQRIASRRVGLSVGDRYDRGVADALNYVEGAIPADHAKHTPRQSSITTRRTGGTVED
jgi:hypothetical protein